MQLVQFTSKSGQVQKCNHVLTRKYGSEIWGSWDLIKIYVDFLLLISLIGCAGGETLKRSI
jgi:hypothetical protein